MSKFCQSCGMPLKKDPQGGGSEADGSKSTTYCSLCYQDGAFHLPDISAREMQDFCVVQMKKQGMNGVLAWLLTRNIPRLDRWQAN